MSGILGPLPSPRRKDGLEGVDEGQVVGGEMLSTGEVAARLGVSAGAVRVMQSRGTGPPSVKVGGRRLYPVVGFEEWLAARVGES